MRRDDLFPCSIILASSAWRRQYQLGSRRGTEAIDADRLIELVATCREGLIETAPHGRRHDGFLAVSVEAHVRDHLLGKGVEAAITPRIRVGRDFIGGEARARKMRKGFGGRFSYRGFVVE
jgi:hypothetical protein